ncbi:MAG TPA: hypothetical protein VFZ60_05225, partial [Nitrososphaeraceae archaeon]
MGKKIVATGVIIAVIAFVIYFAVSSSNFLTSESSRLGIFNMNFTEASIFNRDAMMDAIPPELSIKDITAKIVDGDTGNFSIIFNVFNPNKGTIMLESISYNVYSNSIRIVSGD